MVLLDRLCFTQPSTALFFILKKMKYVKKARKNVAELLSSTKHKLFDFMNFLCRVASHGTCIICVFLAPYIS